MSPLVLIILSALAIMLASLAGILFMGSVLREWIGKNLSFLLTFSAGVFFVTALNLAGETFELVGVNLAIVAVLTGYLLFLIFDKLLPESHHHYHDEDCEHKRNKKAAIRMLASDAIHNIGDGVLLVPAFLASVHLGIATAISIFVHELLQEVSEFFVLRGFGYSTWQALSRNFLVSATILIGVAFGLSLKSFIGIQAMLLGVAAGGFLYIVFHDLILNREQKETSRGKFWIHILIFILGALLIFGVNNFSSHSHSLEDDHDHEDHEAKIHLDK